jgi:hypothetical protein
MPVGRRRVPLEAMLDAKEDYPPVVIDNGGEGRLTSSP